MNITDTHVHTSLSFDSSEPMENYVKKAVRTGHEYFISTEHADLESHVLNGGDILRDLDKQAAEVKRLNSIYPVNVLMGVEIGWRRSIHDRCVKVAESQPFDMIILSLHETEYADVSYPDYIRGRTVDECYDEYLGLICEAITSFDNFDTFAHVDYLLRYIGDTDLYRHREKLEKVFLLLIEKGKALEINTKIFPQAESVRRAEDIISMYTAVGGKKVTLGSDAHSADRYSNNFDTVVKILKGYGINKISMFVKRKEILIDI